MLDPNSEVCVDFRKSFSEAHFWNEFKERRVPKARFSLIVDAWKRRRVLWDHLSGSDYLLKDKNKE